MFSLFVAVSFFLVMFILDKMQFWMKMASLVPLEGPMVYGPLAKLAWRFSGKDEGRFMLFQFFWTVAHIVVIGAAFDYIKLGRAKSGIIPASIVALALGVYYGQLYLRRRKV
jgi:hypothetical protein